MSFPSVSIIARPIKKEGIVSVKLRYTQNRIPQYISLGIKVRETDWAPDRQGWVTRAVKNQKQMNELLRSKLEKAEAIIAELATGKHGQVSFENFKSKFLGVPKQELTLDFIAFIRDEIEYRKGLNGKFAKDTLETYDKLFRLLKAYSPKLSVDDLTTEWLDKYIRTMYTDGKEQGTVWSRLKFIKGFWNLAKQRGFIKKTTISPFSEVMFKPKHKEKEKLTDKEINLLFDYYHNEKVTLTPTKREVLRACLFCCYTGLPYKDVFELSYKDIEESPQPDVWVVTKTRSKNKSKTGDKFFIPLIPEAHDLIKPIEGSGFVFKYVTNQVANRYLKQILTEIGIDRHITTHGLRHSFATILFNLGLRLEDVQNLLAHADARQTLTYAKFSRATLLNTIKPFRDHLARNKKYTTALHEAVDNAAKAIRSGLDSKGTPKTGNVAPNKIEGWANGAFSEEIEAFLLTLDSLGLKVGEK